MLITSESHAYSRELQLVSIFFEVIRETSDISIGYAHDMQPRHQPSSFKVSKRAALIFRCS